MAFGLIADGAIVFEKLIPQYPVGQDAIATIATFTLALAWLRTMDGLAHTGQLEPTLSRKLIHIGTGPLFVLCWPLFSATPLARYWAALVPLAITCQFFAIGIGLIRDPAAVSAMTRHNDPQEILRGPLLYGLAFIACTILFWRDSPVGILALMVLCGGDGLADIVGRRWGTRKLPFHGEKSWAGSTAMFAGSWVFGFGFLLLFSALGHFPTPLHDIRTAGIVAAIAAIATLVEALPCRDIDNLTLTVVAVGLGWWWL